MSAIDVVQMSAPPSEIVCPLISQVFVDPVIASDGHTYERSAITHHVTRGLHSPFDGSMLEDRFFPNVMIKLKASQFTAEQSAARLAVATSAPVQSAFPTFSFPQQLQRNHNGIVDDNILALHKLSERKFHPEIVSAFVEFCRQLLAS